MEIETSKAIKLFFPNPSLLLVYLEAIANALDAGATEISIRIEIYSFDSPTTLKITITDNGCGFTDENFDRFKTILKTSDAYHKGIGRLVFLNYFDRVEVDSYWNNYRRSFVFKKDFDGNAPAQELQEKHSNQTSLVFANFTGGRINSYDYLRPASLKDLIFENFLPTLHNLKSNDIDFQFTITLDTSKDNPQKEFFPDSTTITPSDLPDMNSVSFTDPSIDAYSSIKILYNVQETGGKGYRIISFIVDGRTIKSGIIQESSIPLGYSIVFLFESEIFNTISDTSRQKLNLPEHISKNTLERVLRREVGKILAENIPKIVEKNNKTKEKLVINFPHLLGYFDENVVGLIDRDEALDNAQTIFFKAQKEVLQCEHLDDSTYEKSIELSSRTLTEYILYRDKIIRKMKEITEENSEADIHNLIVPRYEEYRGESIVPDVYKNNAWLLDDKFMAFQTILSDARMDKVINEIRLGDETVETPGRPDIAMIFSADPEGGQAVDVVVVEIKKKSDDEKENLYAISQLLDRAVKLAAYCPNIQRIWYYAVIQINDQMETRLTQLKWAPLFSKGKVFYQDYQTSGPGNKIIPTPTFILSFDAIVSDAESRNHTFLEILRAGMKKYAEKQQISP